MKKTKKILGALAAIGFVSALTFTVIGCKGNDDDDSTPEVAFNEISEDVDNVAFNILRELCDLSALQSDNSITDPDSSVVIGGIENLPDNWQNMTFKPDIGFLLDEDKPTEFSYPVVSTEKAKEWVYDLIGVTPDGDYTGTSKWTIAGFGRLVFNAVKDNPFLFGTIDIDIPVIPDLKKIFFVPPSVVEAKSSENSFKGKPYFTGGDIIQRLSDNTLWMCVRPAGGPLHKDKSYWICLHPFDKSGNSIIKSESKYYHLKYNIDKAIAEPYREWVYAKGLMSIKTAKAAFHTFAMIAYSMKYKDMGAIDVDEQFPFDDLKDVGGINYHIGDLDFHKDYGKAHVIGRPGFRFAYGSPKKDSTRETKVTDQALRQHYSKVAQVSYIQPVIDCDIDFDTGNKVVEKISTYTHDSFDYTANTQRKYKVLNSACDTFDDAIIRTFWKTVSFWGKPLQSEEGLDYVAWNADEWLYDYTAFLHKVDTTNNKLCFCVPRRTDALSYSAVETDGERVAQLSHVIFSPELVIKDNKGNATATRNPLKESEFIVIHRFADTHNDVYDWWKTVQNVVRKVDGREVNWQKENK